ncbi:hypothetical protein K8354_00710 [Polaribacter litorisediminis]|uniref:hypothetical protein n=1 Tax=Polaribacter litorisediminis TaxID=1908341 RepID=UPI001CC1BB11|nr:hypothetical protein [Polaribacter litorisediminis]UAM98381.1 hypothetical protein K8354_00710 [Polaribacter litorisediminis]
MSNFFSDLKKDTLNLVKSYSWIPFLLLGGTLVTISFLPYFKDIMYLSKGFYSIGTTIITAVIFLTIVKSKQFSEIFQKQLRSIIYCTEHLEKRKDIRELWMNTSKAMYEKNFPELCEKLEDNLEKYIPIDSSKYYENYIYKVDISFDKDNENYLILNESESFDLISRTKKDIEYNSSCVFEKEDYKEEISDYIMKEFKVNKKVIDCKEPQLKIDKNYKGKKIVVQHIRSLSGENKYSIEKEEYKRYSLKVENTKAHTCSHIFHNYVLEVTHPKNLEVKFYENGTLNNFEKKPNREIGNSIFQRFEYQGIMFKNQGTRMIFRDLRK